MIVTADRLIDNWSPQAVDELTPEHLQALLLDAKPAIVLLGTGGKLCFPHPKVTQIMTAARIGLEVMDTKAACRTYNILVQEGREVAAALLLH